MPQLFSLGPIWLLNKRQSRFQSAVMSNVSRKHYECIRDIGRFRLNISQVLGFKSRRSSFPSYINLVVQRNLGTAKFRDAWSGLKSSEALASMNRQKTLNEVQKVKS